MDKLEQVIKDVELGLRIAKGTDCGLFKTSVKSAEQILELLKEKQPRVLTLEAVKQADVVWNEYTSISGYVECMLVNRCLLSSDCVLADKLGRNLYFELSEYNKSWRCWSERPTDEQMKATEWDGEQK